MVSSGMGPDPTCGVGVAVGGPEVAVDVAVAPGIEVAVDVGTGVKVTVEVGVGPAACLERPASPVVSCCPVTKNNNPLPVIQGFVRGESKGETQALRPRIAYIADIACRRTADDEGRVGGGVVECHSGRAIDLYGNRQVSIDKIGRIVKHGLGTIKDSIQHKGGRVTSPNDAPIHINGEGAVVADCDNDK